MKQFIICTFLSVLIYLCGSFISKSYNPMDWTNNEGTTFTIAFIVIVWLAPIMLNYLEGKENFKN